MSPPSAKPRRISREQARDDKTRTKAFSVALKARAKAAGWGYAGNGIFRRRADWFLSALPTVKAGAGLDAMATIKPWSVDPVFWQIMGFPENDRQPLSFRAIGAFVVRPPPLTARLLPHESDPDALVTAFLDWATAETEKTEACSIEKMIADIAGMGERRRHFVATEICLRILAGDVDTALDLCKNHRPHDFGGFSNGGKTFFHLAESWISKEKCILDR